MTTVSKSKRGQVNASRRTSSKPARTEGRSERRSNARPNSQIQFALATAILLTGLWAYSETILDLVRTWTNEPDYSHGFLVVPVAIYFLWMRRSTFPGLVGGNLYLVAALFSMSVLLRFADAMYFIRVLDGWSMVFWVASLVAAIGGLPLLRWSLPAVGFLVFMIPLPFSLESTLSYPLQRVATKLSTFCLQVLGQPAIAEGNVILVGEERLDVAQACSGLRLFMSMMALAYVYVVVVRRAWWEKALLVLALVPVAICSNSARVVCTGLLYRVTSDPGLRKLAHDFAGLGMIVFAAALFALVLWYLKLLIREEEVLDAAALVREG